MKIVFEGQHHGDILSQLKNYIEWANKKDPQDEINREVLLDVVNHVDYKSNSGDDYYVVTTVENEAVACTCKGFHFRKECSHIEGYNGSRT